MNRPPHWHATVATMRCRCRAFECFAGCGVLTGLVARVHLLALLIALPSAVFAQTPTPRLPPAAEPGAGAPTIRPPSGLDRSPDIVIDESDRFEVPSVQRKVRLRAISVEGASVYPLADFEPFYAQLLNTSVDVSQIFAVARAIQDKYRADGYVLTRALIPAQDIDIDAARVNIRVVEGFVSTYRIEGNAGGLEERLSGYLGKIVESRPVNLRDLERYLLLINDVPGVVAKGVLRPAEGEAGASELVLRVERKNYDAVAVLNNRGSRFTGPWRAMGLVSGNSLFDLGERIDLTYLVAITPKEQQLVRFGYTQPIGFEGLTLGVSASYGPSEPGGSLRPLDAETTARSFSALARYPLIRRRSTNLEIEGGFDIIDSDVDFMGTPFSRDRLRVLHIGARFDHADVLGGRVSGSASVRQGLGVLGANEPNDRSSSRENGTSRFTSIASEIVYGRSLTSSLAMSFAVKGQYAIDTLLSDAEFRVGGERYGRGYDPSEIAGEHGVAASLELQRNQETDFEAFPFYQLYAFYDFAKVWNRDRDAEPSESLASIGAGIRTRLFDDYHAGFEIAKPLTRRVGSENDRDLRVFFQLTAQF